eukprot:2837209-Pleurochrysis_carterae.AAC.2
MLWTIRTDSEKACDHNYDAIKEWTNAIEAMESLAEAARCAGGKDLCVMVHSVPQQIEDDAHSRSFASDVIEKRSLAIAERYRSTLLFSQV